MLCLLSDLKSWLQLDCDALLLESLVCVSFMLFHLWCFYWLYMFWHTEMFSVWKWSCCGRVWGGHVALFSYTKSQLCAFRKPVTQYPQQHVRKMLLLQEASTLPASKKSAVSIIKKRRIWWPAEGDFFFQIQIDGDWLPLMLWLLGKLLLTPILKLVV